MPDEFLLTYVSFSERNQPFLEYQQATELMRQPLFGQELRLEFDTRTKFCTGWVDFEAHCSRACPDGATVDGKYENCLQCRNRTGFNPAFYHAATVSQQQQKINQQPHYLYLAYFAPGVVKVGISQQSRGIRRLLEQGARMALRLETFPTALIARQYEARISQLPGIVEHLPQNKKVSLISEPFDEAQATAVLASTVTAIEEQLGITFTDMERVDTERYFYHTPVDITTASHISDHTCIVGQAVAMIGTILITRWHDNLLAYNLKSYLGYRARRNDNAAVALPEEQLTLF